MKLVVTFSLIGFPPVPWSVPDIGNKTLASGKRLRFSSRKKKTNLSGSTLSLEDWQKLVKSAAKKAMEDFGRADPLTSSLRIEYEFYAAAPDASLLGTIWPIGLKRSKKTGEWGKVARLGKTDPDKTNLEKGAEDALQGVVCADDCIVRASSSLCLYATLPGMKVTVYELEETDYKGETPRCLAAPSTSEEASDMTPAGVLPSNQGT